MYISIHPDRLARKSRGGCGYRNLKINIFIRKSRHLVIEAEPVLADRLRCEDIITLTLLAPLQDDLLSWADDGVVDIERAARLDLGTVSI